MDLGNDEIMKSLNEMIQSANQSLNCDENCQKQQKIDEANQALLNAQKTLANGPQQLLNAQKELTLMKEGPVEWSNIQLADFKNKSNIEADKLRLPFMQQIQILTQANPDLLFEDSYEWLDELEKKNKALTYKIDKSNKLLLTNNRKAGYEDEELILLNKWYSFFAWIYSILLLVYIFGLLFLSNDLPWFRRLLLVLGFVLLPYSIHLFFVPTFFFILHALQSIYTYFIPQNVYSSMRPLLY